MKKLFTLLIVLLALNASAVTQLTNWVQLWNFNGGSLSNLNLNFATGSIPSSVSVLASNIAGWPTGGTLSSGTVATNLASFSGLSPTKPAAILISTNGTDRTWSTNPIVDISNAIGSPAISVANVTGTLPVANLPVIPAAKLTNDVALLSANQTFTGTNTFAGLKISGPGSATADFMVGMVAATGELVSNTIPSGGSVQDGTGLILGSSGTSQTNATFYSSGAAKTALQVFPQTGSSSNVVTHIGGTNGTSGVYITDQGNQTNSGTLGVSGTSYLKGAVTAIGQVSAANLVANTYNLAGSGTSGGYLIASRGGLQASSAAGDGILLFNDYATAATWNRLGFGALTSIWPALKTVSNSTPAFVIVDGTGTNAADLRVSGLVLATNGFASYSVHTPVSITPGASPWNYTNLTTTMQKYRLSGATAYSVSVDGAAVFGSLAGDVADTLAPNEYFTLTYTVAPTCYTNSW